MKSTMSPGTTSKGQDRHQRRMRILAKVTDRPLAPPIAPKPANYEKEIVVSMRSKGEKLQ